MHGNSLRTAVRAPVSIRFVSIVSAFLFLKPLIDLTWNVKVFGDFSMLHVTGAIVALVGGFLFINFYQFRPVAHTLFFLFFCQHLIAAFLTYQYGTTVFRIGVADLLLRVFDSIVFLHIGYLIGLRRQQSEGALLLKSMFAGNAIALLINLVAISLGLESYFVSSDVERHSGLYYDPGVVGINAVQNIVFCIFLLGFREPSWRYLLCAFHLDVSDVDAV